MLIPEFEPQLSDPNISLRRYSEIFTHPRPGLSSSIVRGGGGLHIVTQIYTVMNIMHQILRILFEVLKECFERKFAKILIYINEEPLD